MKLWRYIQGYRKGKEAHDLEKQAMSDPFLAHALRGFDRVEGDHISHIERLQKDIRRKRTQKRRYLRAASIAASILLVIGVGAYFMVNQTPVSDTMPVAVQQELRSVQSAPAPSQPAIAQQRKVEVQTPKESPQPPELSTVEESILDIEDAPSEDATITATEEETDQSIQLEEVQVTANQAVKRHAMLGSVATIAAAPEHSRKVTGKVTDEQGEPLVGVSVQVEGTNQGAVTDSDGQFEITAPDGSKLRASYIGYESLEKLIEQDSVMNFAMNEDNQSLDEVVVTDTRSRNKSIAKDPKPVDGMRKYKKYLKENLIRPVDDVCREVKGTVVLSFYVGSDGRPQNVTVTQSLCASADAEAIRLVTAGPDWKEGTNPVTLEIKF